MKDQNLISACNHQYQTNEPNNQVQLDVTGPSNKINSPSHENVHSNSNQQQQPPIVQWSHTPQNATQQLMAVSFPNQVLSHGVFNQWQQFLNQLQVFAQSISPSCQSQWPGGANPLLGGPNVPPIFQTLQAHQTPLPNMPYHVAYPFPGFPGPCNHSSCLGQMQQLQHSYAYNSPGAPGFSSATPTMPSCSTSGKQTSESGTIKPTAKLSQKHQQLWEAQSVENVQLRSMVDKLQAEVSDYKDRLVKLEEEVSSLKQDYKNQIMKLEQVSSLKQIVETPKAAEVIQTIPAGTGQPPKRGRGRGRPKRLASMEESHEPSPQSRGRKPALNPFQLDSNSPIFEKVVLKRVENKDIPNHPTTRIAQQENSGKILNGVSNSAKSTYQGRINQEYQGIKMSGSGAIICCASGVKINFERDKDKDMKMVYSQQSQPSKVLGICTSVSTKYIGNTSNGNHGLTSIDSARDVLDAANQSLFHNGSLVEQREKISPGLNSANEEDDSVEMEDAIVGSSKDENEEGMIDDTSFSA
ncbi:hypothetical protein TanjilG_25896 [Lupinus angustifolius]|uniref:Uncharacterized protein n=2 Tax=Lupinus angustifolius TaxID=3871 RepID=A0A1J7GX62_LUPAN|nr:hypothetical protein TanjilG_25896 [Lupinus angustifolius]